MKRTRGCLLDALAWAGILGIMAALCWMIFGVASPPRPDPFQAPPGVDVHPGLQTASVSCDWCSQMTKNPAPAAQANPSSTPTGGTTVTVTVTAPAPSAY